MTTLVPEIEYDSRITCLNDISSESVLTMLRDIREKLTTLELSFKDKPLKEILKVVERGYYESLDGKINLNSARGVIQTYRKYSEKSGCQSCAHFRRETIDAQDATSGWYCGFNDPDYNPEHSSEEVGVKYSGFSPKVKRHYENPCESWKVRFSPRLDKLVNQS